MSQGGRDLYDFLQEAELQHYYKSFCNDLKVTGVSQLKYVEEEDLLDMGMAKPEMRRLRKFFRKECPQGALGKLRKKMLTKSGNDISGVKSGVNSPPSPSHSGNGGISTRASNKHIIPEDAIALCKTLGTGEFGTVQQGIWTDEDGNRIQVAIKCLSREKLRAGMPDFLKEASIMHSIDHGNIVQLHGVVLGADTLWLVSELAPLRSLLECLKEPALRASFPVTQLCEFGVQIADGMHYLETKRLIHRDLAARNILVFAKDKVKISDFGLSRALGVGKDYYQVNFSISLKLPIAWCAPECINYLKFTPASDVWAFSVTLWEMFSYGFQPWAAFTGQQILDAIDEPSCQRLDQPEFCPATHYALMLSCWAHNPEERPTFAQLGTLLTEALPPQVKTACTSSGVGNMKDFLQYEVDEVITVLDKKPENVSESGLWKGVTSTGRIGLFRATDVAPVSPAMQGNASGLRKNNSRRNTKPAGKKITSGMISLPQNDLRHTGHVGYDGAVFGDLGFIGDNYDQLPVKVVAPYKPQDDLTQSSFSLPTADTDDSDDCHKGQLIENSQSKLSLFASSSHGGSSCLADASLASTDDTLTDVSSMPGDTTCVNDASPSSINKAMAVQYEEISDDELDFKMPEISSPMDFDLGPSFMDEVLRAISEPKKTAPPTTTKTQPLDVAPSSSEDTSPLLQRDPIPQMRMGAGGFHNATMQHEKQEPPVGVTDGRSVKSKDSSSRKSKLKLEEEENDEEMMPFQESNRRPGELRPMSASDNRQIDATLELATHFAQLTGGQKEPEESSSVATATSNHKSGSLRRNGSPRAERRVFSEEMASISSTDLTEAVGPEAQEAYNVLVVKGSGSGSMMQPTAVSVTTTTTAVPTVSKSSRAVNMNIRAPQGIPGRGERRVMQQVASSEEVETNPLRRLRDTHTVVPPRYRRPPSDSDSSESSGAKISSNSSLFSKMKEDGASTTCNGGNEVPLPPRSSRLSLGGAKPPRQRRFPLSEAPSLEDSPTSPDDPTGGLNVNSSASVTTSSAKDTSSSSSSAKDTTSSLSLSAADLGLFDSLDAFWGEDVDFDRLLATAGPQTDSKDDPSSYEQRLESALDETDQRVPGQNCDEVRLMKRILGSDVSSTECVSALQETGQCVGNALKLIKLRHLIALGLAGPTACKDALLDTHWDVQRAARTLTEPDPEFIHL